MKICIVGGRGRMGQLFQKILVGKGHDVSVIGRQNYASLSSLVNEADLTVVSVPLSVSAQTITDIGKVITKNKCVVNFSSVMGTDMAAMKKLPCASAFTHPLFGPRIVSLKDLNIIVVPLKKNKTLRAFIDILNEEDAVITQTSVEEHDSIMAVIQGLVHFSSLASAQTVAAQKAERKKGFSTTLYQLNRRIYDKILSQSADMIMNMQFKNKNLVPVLEQFKKHVDQLLAVVKKKDVSAFEKMFVRLQKDLPAYVEPKNVRVKKRNIKWDKNAVAILGPEGSYTDAASRAHDNQKKIYVDSIIRVIDAVKSKKVKEGIIPIENSTRGPVVETMDGIHYANLHIQKAITLPIHHCVAALSKDVKVEKIYSHQQALTQCEKYLRKKYPNAELIQTLSTAEAFKLIKDHHLHNAIAVGPVVAAELYGLEILKKNVEDEKGNRTKFVVVSHAEGKQKGNITSLVILPSHEKQGLLFNLLKFFDEEKINLTKIESRPMRDKLGKYIFYIDIDGNCTDAHVKRALAKINKELGKVKVLGSFDVEDVE